MIYPYSQVRILKEIDAGCQILAQVKTILVHVQETFQSLISASPH